MLKIPWGISDTDRQNSHSLVHSSYLPQKSLPVGLPESSGQGVGSLYKYYIKAGGKWGQLRKTIFYVVKTLPENEAWCMLVTNQDPCFIDYIQATPSCCLFLEHISKDLYLHKLNIKSKGFCRTAKECIWNKCARNCNTTVCSFFIVGWECVSKGIPLTDALSIIQMTTWMNMSQRRNDIDTETRTTRRKPGFNATLSTISPTWDHPRMEPGLPGWEDED
jgi:hypothetical protein